MCRFGKASETSGALLEAMRMLNSWPSTPQRHYDSILHRFDTIIHRHQDWYHCRGRLNAYIYSESLIGYPKTGWFPGAGNLGIMLP